MAGTARKRLNDFISFLRFPFVCFAVLVFMGGATLQLYGQDLSTASTIPALEKAVNELRILYQDMYPRFQDIRTFREAGRSDRAQEMVSDLRDDIQERMTGIRQLLDSVNAEDRTVEKRVHNVRKILTYFHRYQKKFLSNWEPKNKQLLKAFNRRELIQREMASPEMLRKRFLSDLTGVMNTEGYVSENEVVKNLNKYASQVQNTYREVLHTFLNLLNRVDRARNNEEQEVEEVVRQANRDWKTFWESFREKRQTLRDNVNRTLILYRDREHLTSYQQIRFEKGLRAKRQFNAIMEFQRSVSVDNLFASPKAIRQLLIMMGTRYGKRLVSLLDEHTTSHFATVQKFMQNKESLENVASEEEYGEVKSGLDEWLEEAVFGEFNLEAAVEQIRNVPVQKLSSLVRRLRNHYGQKEKRLGTVIDDLRSYTLDFFEFSKNVRQLPEQYVERFEQVSFESPEQFRNVFPGELSDTVNRLNRRERELSSRLDELENRFDTVVNTHFSREKGREGNTGG